MGYLLKTMTPTAAKRRPDSAHATRLTMVLLTVLVVLLSACATPPRQTVVRTNPVVVAPPQVVVPPPVVSTEFDDDPLFRLLVAEFAGQRGHYELAVNQYLALAKTLQDTSLAQRATRIAVFARNYAAALEAAKVWVELEPQDNEARQIIAAMYIREGDAESALRHLEHVMSQDAAESGNRLRMIANLLGGEEDRLTALQVMESLMSSNSEDMDALMAYALLAIRAEQLDKARAAIDRIVQRTELNNNVAMAYLAVLQEQERLPEAIEWLEHVLGINPKQFGLRLIYARLLADARHYEQARVQFSILSEESPDNTDIVYALGLLNLQANRPEGAQTNFSRLLELETRMDEAHYYLGQIQESLGKSTKALEHYRSLEGGSNYFAAQVRVALILSSDGEVQQARKHLKNIPVENDEQRFHLVRAEGEMLTEHERFDEAMAIYDQALEEGYHTELLYTRAMLAEKMGQLEVLEHDLRAIIEEEPENAQALNALGYTLADRTERYSEALALIERALALSPDDFYILDSMGWVLYRLGRLRESVDYLGKAREIRNDPEVAAHLGEVLWVLGDRDAARDIWESALRDTPNDKKLLDVIERLTP